MKSLLAVILLLPGIVLAQSEPKIVNKKVICESPAVVFKILIESNPEEKPFWVGESDTYRYTMLVNKKTGTWTLLQFDNDIACIIGMGTEHTVANETK